MLYCHHTSVSILPYLRVDRPDSRSMYLYSLLLWSPIYVELDAHSRPHVGKSSAERASFFRDWSCGPPAVPLPRAHAALVGSVTGSSWVGLS
jgi:hypothetical protein